jgi:hypothetical protein
VVVSSPWLLVPQLSQASQLELDAWYSAELVPWWGHFVLGSVLASVLASVLDLRP